MKKPHYFKLIMKIIQFASNLQKISKIYKTFYNNCFSNALEISSSTVASSIVAGIIHFSWLAIFTIVDRTILPDLVFGNLSIITTFFKEDTRPTLLITNCTISSQIFVSEFCETGYKQTRLIGICPFSSSLMPITAHSATSGCYDITSSICPVDNL